MSIGMCMVNEGDDIHLAMHIADENMYKDKNEYYSVHPDRKYR